MQKQWKQVGPVVRKQSDVVWKRFRAACDRFYANKRDYYTNFKNEMQENCALKVELCVKAESLVESQDWKNATEQIIGLQKQWKKIGPVERKLSDEVWKRFRAACDLFFENKARALDEEDQKYEENLQQKLQIIAQIKEYRMKNVREEDIRAMRDFQSRWNAIGFVPFKEKERIQKEYNEAMDARFADIRSLESEKQLNKFRRMVIEVKNSGKGTRGLKLEREKLVLRYRKIEQDIATLENNMGFFAKSKNADSMLTDITRKIVAAKDELLKIEEKIKIIDTSFE